jgi:hypothetical protein
VTSGDPVIFIGIGALLIAVCGHVPTRSASRIVPLAALRANGRKAAIKVS